MSQKSGSSKTIPTRAEAPERQQKRQCRDGARQEHRYKLKESGGQETKETAAFQEFTASEEGQAVTNQDNVPNDIAKIISETKEVLIELEEIRRKEQLYLTSVEEKILTKLSEVLAGVRARITARNAKVHELVSAIGASVQRVEELDKKRERLMQAMSRAWACLEN